MTVSRQREWLTDVLESVPSIVFLALWRGGAGGEPAGWIGSALAGALLLGFRLYRVPYNPVLLGVNLHLLAITPLIVGLFRLGAPDVGRIVLSAADSAVVISVFLVGCALTTVARRGFVGVDGLPPDRRRRYSLLLLALAAAAVPWSFANAGSTLLAVGAPLMALFGLRRYLIARWRDAAGASDAGSLAAAGAPAGDSG